MTFTDELNYFLKNAPMIGRYVLIALSAIFILGVLLVGTIIEAKIGQINFLLCTTKKKIDEK